MSRLKGMTIKSLSTYIAMKNNITRKDAKKALIMVCRAFRDSLLEYGSAHIVGVCVIQIVKTKRVYYNDPLGKIKGLRYLPAAVHPQSRFTPKFKAVLRKKFLDILTPLDLYDEIDSQE